MGKRYFCDYCDRSFQDNLHNRKKHLNGLQHLKAKKVWYDMFRGACDPFRDSLGRTVFSYVYFYFMYMRVCLHVCKHTPCVLNACGSQKVSNAL